MSQDTEQVVTIERVAYDADAIAHSSDGRVMFVAGGVAGDTARVRMT